jgi:hypothetical protein
MTIAQSLKVTNHLTQQIRSREINKLCLISLLRNIYSFNLIFPLLFFFFFFNIQDAWHFGDGKTNKNTHMLPHQKNVNSSSFRQQRTPHYSIFSRLLELLTILRNK